MKRRDATYVSIFIVGLSLTLLCFALQARSTEPASVSSDVCMDCHEDAPRALMGTAHDPSGAMVSCADCHADAAMHVEDPETYKPVVPADLQADSQSEACTACHKDPHALNLYERDPHREANLSCSACHEVHNSNETLSLLKARENDVCLECHVSVRSSFALATHHPVMEDVVACRDCHIEIAQSPKSQTAGGPGEVCVKCHGSMQGPFPYEHEPAVNYSVNDGGCLNCHNPHGSTFPMLLKQSYEWPHFSLCSQCHSVPKHLNNSQHGTQWAGVPCNDCHVDVHGSYVNRNLLDSSLETQGCFWGGGGCHQF